MGAIVTIRVRPGTDINKVKAEIQSKLKAETGENVAVYASSVPQQSTNVNMPTSYFKNAATQ